MDRDTMNNDENYAFDAGGYLIIRNALSPKEVEACNHAIDQAGRIEGMLGWSGALRDPFRDLLVHPVLVWYLNQIIGHGFRLDTEPRLIGDAGGDVTERLSGGDEPRDQSMAYYYQNGRRFCQGVRAIWALADVNRGDGGFVLVPGSHKSNVETPDDVLTGKDDMGLTIQPELQAGDLLLVAEMTVHGMRPWKGSGPQRLLNYSYCGRGVIKSCGTGPEAEQQPIPDWMAELSAEQQAALYKPGYRNTTPPPTLISDGKTSQLIEDRRLVHPSFYRQDPDNGIDPKEFYFWDLTGYLVIRNIMTPEDLELANEAIDKFSDRIVVGQELSRGSKTLAGTGRPTMGGLMQLPAPYYEPFRKMVAHPAVVQRLTWMGGSGFRCGGPTAFCSEKGSTGHALHDANEPLNPSRSYVFKNGRSYCEAVTVTWQLRDVPAGLGGFACAPGSHKAQYPMPQGVRLCEEDMGLVVQPVMKAGDVLFFMDGAQTHGALAWKSEIARRAILIKYSSRNFNRSGGDMAHPQNRWGDLVEGMTDAQLAVMRGPDRDVHGSNVPRLSVKGQDVEVSYERGSALYSKEAPTGPMAHS